MKRRVVLLLLAAGALALPGGGCSSSGSDFFSHLESDGASPLDPVGRWNVVSSWSDGKTDRALWRFQEDKSVQRETGTTGTWSADGSDITIRFEAESLLYIGAQDLISMHGDVIAPGRRGTWEAKSVGP